MAERQAIYLGLKRHFGFESFKGNQFDIISDLMDGHDVFVLMPTGGGKSLCYQLPALLQEGTAIVISPLIALMKNQVDLLRQHCDDDGVAHFLNSSLNRQTIGNVRRDVRSGRTKLLYVAPESLCKEDNIRFLREVNISFYAVDEAHCISEWGHDFRPEYRRIRQIVNEIGVRPVIALTATATAKVQHDIIKTLGMTGARIYKSSFNRPNLCYEVRTKTKDVDRDIIRYIRHNEGRSGIIYCLSRKKVEELTETLKINNIAALPYHAGMDPAQRAANQDAFLMEKVDVIVATIAFGMGIDKPDVRFVIHYDIPKSLEGYYQETGRAGRDGAAAECITFYSRKDLQKLDKLLQNKNAHEQEIPRQLLAETAAYAESSVCRRRVLLHYFGEEYKADNCGCCDNCLHPKPLVEATDDLLDVLETVSELRERYRMEYVINVMIGRGTDEIRSYGHHDIESFGCSKTDERTLGAVVQQGIIAGYLLRDIENYGIIKITNAGREYMKNPVPFKVVKPVDFSEIDQETGPRGGAGCAADPELYSILRNLRKDVARRLSLPPYVVFQDVSLEGMATTYPITIEELQSIPGVGAGKARRFGREFVEVIARHVEENGIERPEDFRVRQMANRSRAKVFIIQAIDRKIDLPEIAESQGLQLSDLLTEIESIVDSGTRLNLSYYIDAEIEEERQEDAMDYFREAQEDDIEEAYRELGDEFTDEEVRLMRIKFISEMGN